LAQSAAVRYLASVVKAAGFSITPPAVMPSRWAAIWGHLIIEILIIFYSLLNKKL